MKLFAIRDRLLDYYQQPFLAETTNQVKAAISTNIMKGEQIDYAQAPHHFELWELAETNDKGEVTPGRIFVTDLNSLIRTRLRAQPETDAGAATAEISRNRVPDTAYGPNGRPTAPPGAIPHPPRTAVEP